MSPCGLPGSPSIFDQPAQRNHARLVPVTGSMPELLEGQNLLYLVVDLHGSHFRLKTLDRRFAGSVPTFA